MSRSLSAASERWPIAGAFEIARGRKTHAEVVVVTITEDGREGRGEAVPYARYGERVEDVLAAIRALAPAIAGGLDRMELADRAQGAVRCAIDLALWDLEAKLAGRSVAELAGLRRPTALTTAMTISIDSPDVMRDRARSLAEQTLLKIKLAGDGLDLARVRAIRDAAPRAALWVDANEGWDLATYDALAPRLAELDVALIEQPLPEASDHGLAGRARPVATCADESAHQASGFAALADRYDAVNVKLDKAGGLTGAIEAIDAARACGLRVVLGCMVSTSLAIAPACLLASRADWIDLDGSVLLSADREGGARISSRLLVPPDDALWGGPGPR